MKQILKHIALVVVALAVMSCSFGIEADVSQVPDADAESVVEFLGTVSMVLGQSGFSSSAAAPYWSLENKAIVSGTQSNYPEVGQTTTWTVTNTGDLYRVDAVTTYPYDSNIVRTQEIYYLKDADGVYDSAGTQWVNQSGAVDLLYREKFETVFANGDVRAETITRSESNVNGNAFESTVTYTQSQLAVDASSLRLSGQREYVELGDADETSRTVITETGTARNLVLNSVHRGQTNITGSITIEIKKGVRTAVSGGYRFVDRAGNLLAEIVVSASGYTTTIY